MIALRNLSRLLLSWLIALSAALGVAMAMPTGASAQETNISAELVPDGPAIPGQDLMLALHFTPKSGWHGYWKNPGDAGYGMQLDWRLPPGWKAGEPLYPVPQRLVISGLMNHVYEGDYAVLVPLKVPAGTSAGLPVPVGLDAQWLACTDKICVPERASLSLSLRTSGQTVRNKDFDLWRAAIPPLIDRQGTFATTKDQLRLAVPLPAALPLPDPHIFIENIDLVGYAGTQNFSRQGDMLIAELPLSHLADPQKAIDGILSFGGERGNGVRFMARPGIVPIGGDPLAPASLSIPPWWTLLLGALAGGLLLNIMPCVFPILSLKALSLARAGESQRQARREALAYTAGVVLACVALGGLMLALRAAGQQVGWAFQLQEPLVVVALLFLALAITANLAGWFDLPSIPITRSGEPASAFATGLLAAVAATPCTGPFMAAALGAALLLPALQGLLLFAALGLGLALPFIAIGFVPALRRLLPRPGKWMETFRKLMAVPMGLTALALLWLIWRLGGIAFAAMGLAAAAIVLLALVIACGAMFRNGALRSATALFLVLAGGTLVAGLPQIGTSGNPASEADILGSEPFSEAALNSAQAEGRPVFLYFTADWCLTCKVNESIAIERDATRAAFAKAGVVTLKGDWTRRDPAITAFLSRQGAAGIPLYLWYAPGAKPQQLDQVLAPDSLVTLAAQLPAPAP